MYVLEGRKSYLKREGERPRERWGSESTPRKKREFDGWKQNFRRNSLVGVSGCPEVTGYEGRSCCDSVPKHIWLTWFRRRCTWQTAEFVMLTYDDKLHEKVLFFQGKIQNYLQRLVRLLIQPSTFTYHHIRLSFIHRQGTWLALPLKNGWKIWCGTDVDLTIT